MSEDRRGPLRESCVGVGKSVGIFPEVFDGVLGCDPRGEAADFLIAKREQAVRETHRAIGFRCEKVVNLGL